MAGKMKVAPVSLLQLLMTVFLLGVSFGRGQYREVDRTVLLCSTLAAMIVLWFAVRAADGGGRLLHVRGLLGLLEIGLSAATCLLLFEPLAGDIIAIYRPGCDLSVALAAAIVVLDVVALAVGVYVILRGAGAARAEPR